MPSGTSGTSLILRLEATVALGLLSIVYWQVGASWWMFALLFFLPDISMLGYLAGARAGAAFYNAVHTSVAPMALGLFGWSMGSDLAIAIAIIWGAHIAFDRMLGYGLKHRTGFGDTHLGRIGRQA